MKGKKFIRGHALAKFWPSSYICCVDKVFCKQRITFQRLFITPFSQFRKCGNGVTFFFCQPKGFSNTSTYLSFISTHILPTQKQLKLNFLVKINDQTTNRTSSFSKTSKQKSFQQNTKPSGNFLSIVIAKIKSNNEKQFPTHYLVHRK